MSLESHCSLVVNCSRGIKCISRRQSHCPAPPSLTPLCVQDLHWESLCHPGLWHYCNKWTHNDLPSYNGCKKMRLEIAFLMWTSVLWDFLLISIRVRAFSSNGSTSPWYHCEIFKWNSVFCSCTLYTLTSINRQQWFRERDSENHLNLLELKNIRK